MIKNIMVFALAALALTGCTDARWEKAMRIGGAARVTCYTASGVYFDDFSTGALDKPENGGDGWYFKSATSGRLTEVSGDCVIDYGASKAADFQAVRR